MGGDPYSNDGTSLTEEIPQPILTGIPGEVANKQGRGFAGASPTRIVATSSLLTELNPDLASIQSTFVRGSESRLGLLMRLEFDEGLALTINELTFGDRTVG